MDRRTTKARQKKYTTPRRRRRPRCEKTGSTSTGQLETHFKDDGRIAEITFSLVLRARVEMVEEKVNGPRESMVVVEMIKELPQKKVYEITRYVPPRFMRLEGEAPDPWGTVKVVFLRRASTRSRRKESEGTGRVRSRQ